jgi:hypothetical protein
MMSREDKKREDKKLEAASQESITAIAAIATHPEFRNLVNEIGARPQAERLNFAKMLATPAEFSRRGIPTPEGVRITMRYFEAPSAETVHQVKLTDEIFRGVVPTGGTAAPPVTVCTSAGSPQPDGTTVCCSVGHVIKAPSPPPSQPTA